jgi:hypothetical protein
MAENVKITLTNREGRHDFVYSPEQLNDLITLLISQSLEPQKVAALHRRMQLKREPIPVDSLAFEPTPAGDIVLLIGARALELQFRIPADHLSEFYQRLTDAIEPDPT